MFETEDGRIFMKNDAGNVMAEITFPETSPGFFVIDHTFVDGSLRGQGIASRLVQSAVDEITSRGGKIGATCSYAVKWLSEHGYKNAAEV